MGSARRDWDHEFDVRHGERRIRFYEGKARIRQGRCIAGSQEIGAQHGDYHAIGAHLTVQLTIAEPLVQIHRRRMILKILSDRKVDDRRDA